MTTVPETRYLRAPDGAYIAYQVSGEGPVDLVPMLIANGQLEAIWTFPLAARFLHRLESFSRLIRWDQRGTGSSDRGNPGTWPPLEEHARDLRSVIDLVGSAQVAIYANNLAGLLAIFFAATYPELVSRLVLDGCYARLRVRGRLSVRPPVDVLQHALERVGEPTALGQGVLDGGVGIQMLAPSFARDPDLAAAHNRLARATNSPETARGGERRGLQ